MDDAIGRHLRQRPLKAVAYEWRRKKKRGQLLTFSQHARAVKRLVFFAVGNRGSSLAGVNESYFGHFFFVKKKCLVCCFCILLFFVCWLFFWIGLWMDERPRHWRERGMAWAWTLEGVMVMMMMMIKIQTPSTGQNRWQVGVESCHVCMYVSACTYVKRAVESWAAICRYRF